MNHSGEPTSWQIKSPGIKRHRPRREVEHAGIKKKRSFTPKPANIIYGRRAVSEAIEAGIPVTEIYVLGTEGSNLEGLCKMADQRGIKIHRSTRAGLDRKTAGAKHQGIVAHYIRLNLFKVTELLGEYDRGTKANSRALILLDGVEDPHNLGAIVRSAEVLGAKGVIVRERRAAGITPAAIKASAGAALRFPVAETKNLKTAIAELKDAGYWVYGLAMDADRSIWQTNLSGKVAFVLGNEGSGLARLTRERCDQLVNIPLLGRIGSLNVSVAAGIALAEWSRQVGNNAGVSA